MKTSESVNELFAALAKAQGAIGGAAKDTTNAYFKSKYADLAACWNACRKPLSDNGLAVIQMPRVTNDGWLLETMLTHASGQWLSDEYTLPVSKDDAQGFGSAMTYARRYALMAVVGIAPEDDDGNAASQTPAPLSKPAALKPLADADFSKSFEKWTNGIKAGKITIEKLAATVVTKGFELTKDQLEKLTNATKAEREPGQEG